MRVFIVGDTGLLDGLALWPMAAQGDVLLYVQVDAIPPQVVDELTRLDPDGIVIVGGSLRVSVAVEADLAQFAPTVRVAGATRYDTPIEISQTLYPVIEPPIEPPVDPPTSLFIPSYQGNSDVGTLTPKDQLPVYDGPTTIRSGTQLIEGVKIVDRLTVRDTANVTVRDCWVIGDIYYALWNDSRWGPSTLTVEDCEIGDPAIPAEGGGLAGGNVTARRVNIHSREDSIKIGSNCLYEMIHSHDKKTSRPGIGHSDDAQSTEHNGATFSYCNLTGLDWDGQTSSAAVILKTDFGDIVDTTIDNCYLGGGAYTMFHRTGGSGSITGTVVTNNIWGVDYTYGHVSSDFPFGVWANNVDTDGNTILGG